MFIHNYVRRVFFNKIHSFRYLKGQQLRKICVLLLSKYKNIWLEKQFLNVGKNIRLCANALMQCKKVNCNTDFYTQLSKTMISNKISYIQIGSRHKFCSNFGPLNVPKLKCGIHCHVQLKCICVALLLFVAES